MISWEIIYKRPGKQPVNKIVNENDIPVLIEAFSEAFSKKDADTYFEIFEILKQSAHVLIESIDNQFGINSFQYYYDNNILPHIEVHNILIPYFKERIDYIRIAPPTVKLMNCAYNNDVCGFGEELQRILKELCVSQKELEDLTGIDQSTISRYIHSINHSGPKKEYLHKICKVIRDKYQYNEYYHQDSLDFCNRVTDIMSSLKINQNELSDILYKYSDYGFFKDKEENNKKKLKQKDISKLLNNPCTTIEQYEIFLSIRRYIIDNYISIYNTTQDNIKKLLKIADIPEYMKEEGVKEFTEMLQMVNDENIDDKFYSYEEYLLFFDYILSAPVELRNKICQYNEVLLQFQKYENPNRWLLFDKVNSEFSQYYDPDDIIQKTPIDLYSLDTRIPDFEKPDFEFVSKVIRDIFDIMNDDEFIRLAQKHSEISPEECENSYDENNHDITILKDKIEALNTDCDYHEGITDDLRFMLSFSKKDWYIYLLIFVDSYNNYD